MMQDVDGVARLEESHFKHKIDILGTQDTQSSRCCRKLDSYGHILLNEWGTSCVIILNNAERSNVQIIRAVEVLQGGVGF